MMTVDGQKPSQSRVSDPAIRAITRSKKAARTRRFIFGVRFPASVLMPHRTDSASQKRSFGEDENSHHTRQLGMVLSKVEPPAGQIRHQGVPRRSMSPFGHSLESRLAEQMRFGPPSDTTTDVWSTRDKQRSVA